MLRYQYLIFDVDDTLLDFYPAFVTAQRNIAKKLGIECSQEYLETDIYKASREIKKMQKLNSNVLTTWYDIVPERNELPCKKLVSNKE